MIKVRVPNWNKFNPRNDRNNFAWFRFENSFFHDQKIFVMTDREKLSYLFLLCEASRKNRGEVILEESYISALTSYPHDEISRIMKKLEEIGLIESFQEAPESASSRRQDDVVTPPNGIATRRYETIRKNAHLAMRDPFRQSFQDLREFIKNSIRERSGRARDSKSSRPRFAMTRGSGLSKEPSNDIRLTSENPGLRLNS